jgi:hypothetical protein
MQRFWKGCAGTVVVGGFVLGASGCFAGPVTLKVVAQEEFVPGGPPSFHFDRDTYVVPAGELDVVYAYPETGAAPPAGQIPHTLVIAGSDELDLFVDGTTRADQQVISLEPGTYTLYCDIVDRKSVV